MDETANRLRARRAGIAFGVAGLHGLLLAGAALLGTPAPPARPTPTVIELVSLPEAEPEPAPHPEPESEPETQATPSPSARPAAPPPPATPPTIRLPDAALPDTGEGTLILSPAEPAVPAGDEQSSLLPSEQGLAALRTILCQTSGPNRPEDCDDNDERRFAALGMPDRFDPADAPMAAAGFRDFVHRPARAPAAPRYPGQQDCISPGSGMLPGAVETETRDFLPNSAQGGAVLNAEPDRVWCD